MATTMKPTPGSKQPKTFTMLNELALCVRIMPEYQSLLNHLALKTPSLVVLDPLSLHTWSSYRSSHQQEQQPLLSKRPLGTCGRVE